VTEVDRHFPHILLGARATPVLKKTRRVFERNFTVLYVQQTWKNLLRRKYGTEQVLRLFCQLPKKWDTFFTTLSNASVPLLS
jgi:hypothetical protein